MPGQIVTLDPFNPMPKACFGESTQLDNFPIQLIDMSLLVRYRCFRPWHLTTESAKKLKKIRYNKYNTAVQTWSSSKTTLSAEHERVFLTPPQKKGYRGVCGGVGMGVKIQKIIGGSFLVLK